MSTSLKTQPQYQIKNLSVNFKSCSKGNKVPLIPHLLVSNKIVSDFTEKANLFDVFSLLNVHISLIIVFYLPVNTL